ncbi:MAG: hypothetical protein NTW50_00165 [Candidatus Berkelbacteria bacterium]|nr:hypothetical protein [Candidatus Berkelbacteria bacterium]
MEFLDCQKLTKIISCFPIIKKLDEINLDGLSSQELGQLHRQVEPVIHDFLEFPEHLDIYLRRNYLIVLDETLRGKKVLPGDDTAVTDMLFRIAQKREGVLFECYKELFNNPSRSRRDTPAEVIASCESLGEYFRGRAKKDDSVSIGVIITRMLYDPFESDGIYRHLSEYVYDWLVDKTEMHEFKQKIFRLEKVKLILVKNKEKSLRRDSSGRSNNQ